MRILLGADFHLGARLNFLGSRAAARRDDLNRAFARFVDVALEPARSIDLVLLLGDIFDGHAPPAELVDHVAVQVERLLAAGLPVAAIPGTHDGYGYPDSVYRSGRWPSGVHLLATPTLSRRTLTAGGETVHLYGLAYDPIRTPADPLAGLQRDRDIEGGRHVAMVHGSLPAGPEWEFRRRDLPIPTADLAASGLDLLAMGHYHNFMEKRFGSTLVVYPGTLEGLKFSETGVRSFSIATLDDSGARIERVPYPGREMIETTIDLDRIGSEVGALEEKIRSLAGGDRIVRVVLTGRVASNFQSDGLARKLAAEFFHLVIDDRTLKIDERWAARLAGERTIRGFFVRKMQERIGAAPESERPVLEMALRAGLAEFGATEAAGHGD
jgi:DNA repair exonuclease SbcCD nuclease subunit